MAVSSRDIWNDLRDTAARFAERDFRPVWQVVLVEPGLQALAWYRVSHAIQQAGWGFFADWLAGQARWLTGIDLHPAARIGRRCMIARGGATLVGATAVIGNDCSLEPGVCLLGAGVPLPGQRHHPSLGDRVTIEAGALLVGEIFVGNDVRILAGAVVDRDVPDGGIALGVPGRVLAGARVRPDPDARAIQALAERLYTLEEQVQVMAFATQRQLGPAAERWRTRQPEAYGPIPAVEVLIDGAGI